MTSYDVFAIAERIEVLAGETYQALARRFRESPEAERLFTRLAGEEQQHAKRVTLLAGMYRSDPRAMRAVAGGEILRDCLAAVERFRAEAEAGRLGEDVAAVKVRLVGMEEELRRAHADFLARNSSPALVGFFAKLAAQDAAHADLLR